MTVRVAPVSGNAHNDKEEAPAAKIVTGKRGVGVPVSTRATRPPCASQYELIEALGAAVLDWVALAPPVPAALSETTLTELSLPAKQAC